MTLKQSEAASHEEFRETRFSGSNVRFPPTNKNFGSRVVDADGLQDGRSVVGYRHHAAFCSTEQNLILQNNQCALFTTENRRYIYE